MLEIHATVTIDTPVEKVLEFIEDPENLAKCSPKVTRVLEVRRRGRHAGDSFRLIYRVLGMAIKEESALFESSPRAGTLLTGDSRCGKRSMDR